MSQNSVISRLQFEAINRRDIDAFVAFASPEVEWEDAMFWTEPPRIYRGRDELREWAVAVLDPWEEFQVEIKEITEAPDDRVLVEGYAVAQFKDSEAVIRQRGWFVFRVSDGMITRRQVFLDHDEALKAAGLG